MNPEDEFRRLQYPARWNELAPAPRRVPPPPGSGFRGAIVLAAVVVIVVAGTIGALRLGDLKADRAAAPTVTPTVSPTQEATAAAAATYTIRGDQQVHTATVHGVGTSGPTAFDAVLTELRSIFGSAVRGTGGDVKQNRTAFMQLKRAPTTSELPAVRTLPHTVRLHWSDWPTDKTLGEIQSAAFKAIGPYSSDGYGGRDSETNAISMTYWPALGSTLNPEQIAKIAAEDGTKVLVTDHLPLVIMGPATISQDVFAINSAHCVTLDGRIVITPPGSAISTNGRLIRLRSGGSIVIGASPSSKPHGAGGCHAKSYVFIFG